MLWLIGQMEAEVFTVRHRPSLALSQTNKNLSSNSSSSSAPLSLDACLSHALLLISTGARDAPLSLPLPLVAAYLFHARARLWDCAALLAEAAVTSAEEGMTSVTRLLTSLTDALAVLTPEEYDARMAELGVPDRAKAVLDRVKVAAEVLEKTRCPPRDHHHTANPSSSSASGRAGTTSGGGGRLLHTGIVPAQFLWLHRGASTGSGVSNSRGGANGTRRASANERPGADSSPSVRSLRFEDDNAATHPPASFTTGSTDVYAASTLGWADRYLPTTRPSSAELGPAVAVYTQDFDYCTAAQRSSSGSGGNTTQQAGASGSNAQKHSRDYGAGWAQRLLAVRAEAEAMRMMLG